MKFFIVGHNTQRKREREDTMHCDADDESEK